MTRPDLPRRTEASPFATGPFDTVESSFRLLCAGPDPLSLPAGAVAGLPGRPVPLDELRARLLHPSARHATRDAALGLLLTRARAERGPWLVGLAGVLLPGLRTAVAPLTAVCPGKSADIEAEALVGLLEGIARTEPGHPRAAARLCWLARNRARRLVRAELAEAGRPALDPVSAGPPRPHGHPDLVLARAVEEGVICAADAALVGDTRLGLLDLTEAATALGIDYKTAHQRRRRAETALAAWLTGDPQPGGDPPRGDAPGAAGSFARSGGGFVENRAGRPCSPRGGRPRAGRADRRPAVRHPLPTPDPRR